jgi:circadian clock protein KaiC
VEQDDARVIVLDSLNGYLKAMPDEDHLALQLHELRTYLGQQGVITLLILSQPGGVGALSSPVDISYLADAVIVLRFYEAAGEIRKAITMLKKRTGPHEAAIREFQIDTDGIRLGQPLRHIQGVLTGTPQHQQID